MNEFKSVQEKYCTALKKNVVFEVTQNQNGERKHTCLYAHQCKSDGNSSSACSDINNNCCQTLR